MKENKRELEEKMKKANRMASKLAYWNYRVIRHSSPGEKEGYFEIFEVFYDKNDVPHSWTADPIHPLGTDTKELKKDINFMLEALKKPVLTVKIVRGKEKLIEWKNEE